MESMILQQIKDLGVLGQDHDTAQFAVASLKRWWKQTGWVQYDSAKYLMITADSGGSNGYRLNQFKWELQQFAIKDLCFPFSPWNEQME